MENMYKNYEELPLVLNAQAVSNVLGISRTNAYALFNRQEKVQKQYCKKKSIKQDFCKLTILAQLHWGNGWRNGWRHI